MTERIIETRTCTHCSEQFTITDVDVDFLTRLAPMIAGQKIDLPYPTHCPKCRKIRRYAWRNEKNIYKRKCDATGKDIISLFSPDAPCPVYESEYWYSDRWDARSYGRDFDFSGSFFEQWGELKKLVPMPWKAISQSIENSEYSDNCSNLKNCYLCFNVGDCEDCLYLVDAWNIYDCIDCLNISDCELCYELLDSRDCYGTHFSYALKNCRDSRFLIDCDGCQNCYGCFGLKNQQYHIYNTSYSEWVYRDELARLLSLPIHEQKSQYEQFLSKSGYTGYNSINTWSENTMDSSRVFNSKNVSSSNGINSSEDIRYAHEIRDARLVMDMEIWWDRMDRVYESHQIGEQASNIFFSTWVWGGVYNIYYSGYCINNVHDCFWCIWLRNAEYCILNQQYTKKEYEALVPKIIEQMSSPRHSLRGEGILGTDSSSLEERGKGGEVEWGEFFPATYSHFGYNQTMNMVKYPLSKEEAICQWFHWSDYEAPFPKVEKTIPAKLLPETIDEVPDDILNWAIECEISMKPFRIIKQELEFYRKHNLPIPRRHPDQRYLDRLTWHVNY